jgi:aldehyde:ferredoxin oxidoreductase
MSFWVHLLRVFNLRDGIAPELDQPSERYFSIPVDGTVAGVGIAQHWGRIKARYYANMGWDASGRPTPETLRNHGLAQAAIDLWGQEAVVEV